MYGIILIGIILILVGCITNNSYISSKQNAQDNQKCKKANIDK